MKTKKILEVGVKTPGYGLLNEFGEIIFTPQEKGSRKGRVMMVKEVENYSISTTKKHILIHAKFPRKGNVVDNLRELMKTFNMLITDFKEYDF